MFLRSSAFCVQFLKRKHSLTCSTICLTEHSPMSHPSPYLYNYIIRASIEKGCPQKALLDYKTIFHLSSVPLNQQTISFVLEACNLSSNYGTTFSMHANIIKSGFSSYPSLLTSIISIYLICDQIGSARKLYDEIPKWGFSVVSANLIIANYCKVGEFDNAYQLFCGMQCRDVVTWNSMIMGCVRNARSKEAIRLFRRMLKFGVEPDGYTFVHVLSACGRIGALCNGEWAHSLMVEKEIELNSILSAAIIDMYGKCGRVGAAREVFDSVPRNDVSVWNAMITGLASHGLASDVKAVFAQMKDEGVLPDSITFVGILTACSHCGLVEEGRQFFDLMARHYLIQPELQHYGAMIDLLARAGLLEEAHRMIKAMPMEPDAVIWRALLSACRTHGVPKFGESAIEEMANVGSGDYVLLSNIYSSARRWDNAEKVRDLMKWKGIRKSRGLSWIEMRSVIHQFKAGDRSHCDSEAIYKVLEGLTRRVKLQGFVPATELVLMDVSEEEKEENLNYHSEKLATAYGILKTGPGTIIRVSKNLRTCYDCHAWMKMVSSVLNRVIIMRDRIRFHRFESGSCSCRDYW